MTEPGERQPYDADQSGDIAEEPSSSFRDLLRQINARMVLGFLAAVALVVFIAQNTDDAEVNFLWMDWSIPLFLLLLITVALSALCTVIVSWLVGRRRHPEVVSMYMGRRRRRR